MKKRLMLFAVITMLLAVTRNSGMEINSRCDPSRRSIRVEYGFFMGGRLLIHVALNESNDVDISAVAEGQIPWINLILEKKPDYLDPTMPRPKVSATSITQAIPGKSDWKIAANFQGRTRKGTFDIQQDNISLKSGQKIDMSVSLSGGDASRIVAKPHVYETVEVAFTGSGDYDNPYLDVDLWVDLKGPNGLAYRIPAFWDGGQTWRVRLAATAPGDWQWSTGNKTGDPGLDGKTGSFSAIAWTEAEKQANINRRGFIRVSDNGHTLEYADGTPFFYTGDTWWSCLTGVYGFDAPTGPSGISFKDAVKIRKEQGFNGINIIACFPSELTKPIWHKNNQKKKIGEDGSTPFAMDFNEPDLAFAVNYLKINPGYWQQVDRKMQHFWDNGFSPFIETVRRSETWPEENEAEKTAFTNYVRYFWARYGTYNFIFSWLHWDWGPGRNEDYRPMIDRAYSVLGDRPYGQPMTAMAAGASDDTWGTGSKAPWLEMHNVSNVGRDARMFRWLRRQYSLSNPCPSMNIESFYPGWNNKAVEPLNDSEMAQFMMYGSVLNGGFAGHAWGDDYYSGNRKFGGDPHVNGFNKWCAASMGHLKDFMLDRGHDYSKLAPALDHLVDHRQEFLCLALYPDKSLGLGYVSAKIKSSDIQQLKPNSTYAVQWWDIDQGGWKYKTEVKTDANGLLAMPAKPDNRGWAYRISSDKTQPRISLISSIDESKGPARHGLRKLEEIIGTRNMLVYHSDKAGEAVGDFYIIAGLSSEESLATELLTTLPQVKEALSLKKTSYHGKPAIVL